MNLQLLHQRWFALQVRPRYERLTSTILRGKGYEEFVPVSRVARKWSDRKKTIEIPLFQGYVFCRFDVNVQAPVLSTPGAIRLVGNGKEAIPIADEEIESIRTIVSSGQPIAPHPYLTLGKRVRINQGALSGIEGILVNFKSSRRLVLSIDLVQNSIAVEVGDAEVSAIDNGKNTEPACPDLVYMKSAVEASSLKNALG